jgi:hypothetical protein
MDLDIEVFPIIQSRSLETRVVDDISQRLDEVQSCSQSHARSPDAAGVLRNFRFVEDNVQFHGSGSVVAVLKILHFRYGEYRRNGSDTLGYSLEILRFFHFDGKKALQISAFGLIQAAGNQMSPVLADRPFDFTEKVVCVSGVDAEPLSGT